MSKFLSYYLGSIIILSIIYLSDKILFQRNKHINHKRVIFNILIFSIFISLVNLISLDGITRLFSIYTILCLYGLIIFKEGISKTVIVTLIVYLFYVVCETIIALIISGFMIAFNLKTMTFLQNSLFINSIISFFVYLVINIYKIHLIGLVKNNSINDKNGYKIIVVIMITLTLLLIRLPITKWSFNLEFIFTMLLLLGFCSVGIFILKQKADIQKTISMYQQLVEYSDITNNLLEDYRLVSHEHKNQLSIIRGMIDNSNKELVDYVDDLLDKRNIIKYQWVGELNHLPLSGLKGLINYKLMQMEKEKLNTNISISKDLMKTKLNKLSSKQKDNLYSIIGVYLDNAIYASMESSKKEISLEIYKDKKFVTVVLANTYKGKIDIDKIDTYGYTTKGKNHGVGLHIVRKILDEDNIFTQNRSLFQDYYVQELKIDLSKIK